MATEVKVPTTGNAGEDAVIVEWRVSVGEAVAAGATIVTLETAKAAIDVEAPVAGILLAANFAAGDEVPEHAVLAVIGEPGEAVASAPVAAAPVPAAADAPVIAALAPVVTAPAGPVKASPRAALIASRHGIELATITGSGPGGRILIRDVQEAERRGAVAVPKPVVLPVAAADEFVVAPVRGARKVTAQRMQASMQDSAQVTLTRYADADAMLAYAARLRTVTEAQGLPKIGINELVAFATARAIAKHPKANALFSWDGIRQYSTVHLGMAVDTGSALLVPVIRNAESLSLGQFAATSRALIDKARSSSLTAEEMDGATFSITNLGGLGVHWFTPVLNPPQACILGIGATHQLHPQGSFLLPLSLTFDHRAVDGADAAKALAAIADAIAAVDVLTAL